MPESAAISNALVGLYRTYYGKGPTRAKTYQMDDIVLCVLEGGTLKIEETLLDRGQDNLVHEVRHEFQLALKKEFVSTIEQETGRSVRAFLSQFDPDNDVSVELFFLDGKA